MGECVSQADFGVGRCNLDHQLRMVQLICNTRWMNHQNIRLYGGVEKLEGFWS